MSTPCKSCGADIFWCVTAGGKNMPVDCLPSPDGNLYCLQQAGDYGVEVCDEPMIAVSINAKGNPAVDTANAEGYPRYLSHFATCLNAARHRKKGK